jgi:hypothetical protein
MSGGKFMMRFAGTILLFLGVAGAALAGVHPPAPEIDPGSAVSALTLLSGALLVIRGRRKA